MSRVEDIRQKFTTIEFLQGDKASPLFRDAAYLLDQLDQANERIGELEDEVKEAWLQRDQSNQRISELLIDH